MHTKLLTSAEAREALHVSPSKLAQLRAEGMPYVRLGERSYRYDLAQIREWLANRRSVDSIMTGGGRG